MTAVLHTHSRRLDYHPHVHIIVPGGGLNKIRQQWKKLKGKYLFNEFALASVFRAKFIESLRHAGYILPKNIPVKWVVDCQHVGTGLPAIQYLSRYLDSTTGTWKTRKVKGKYFIWLVFQHVLPKGFRRVRDYGFLHGNAKRTLHFIQTLLNVLLPKLNKTPRPVITCKRCGNPMAILAFIPPAWRAG